MVRSPNRPPRARVASILLAAASTCAAALAACSGQDVTAVEQSEVGCQVKPSQTFHDRIEPLLSEDRVTSCNECHLSGVDLSAFARKTPCQTWACLVDQQLVDVASPEDSRILGWILRASPQSQLITSDVIQAEHDGFLEWIQANAACPTACAGVSCGSPDQGPTCDNGLNEPVPALPDGEDTRGCSDVELEQAFYDDVYTSRGRCFPCHFDTELMADKEAPRWISAVGNCQTGAAVTLKRVLGLGLIDTANPENSLLLRKPLSDTGGGVKHGGGAKFTAGDGSYASFLRFIQHYAACQAPAQP